MNTMGTVPEICIKGPILALPEATIISGARATNSAAFLRSLASLPPQRVSIRRLRPSDQPNCCMPCRNAAKRACPFRSFSETFISTPICRARSPCCARVKTGQVAAAEPTTTLMNSRRLIVAPEAWTGDRSNSYVRSGRGAAGDWVMSALGQKQTCAAQRGMSALPPNADMCSARAYVGFGPKADGYDRLLRNAIAAMRNMRGRGRFTDSDLVYWLARRSRTTIQIKVAIISVPPRADASAQ